MAAPSKSKEELESKEQNKSNETNNDAQKKNNNKSFEDLLNENNLNYSPGQKMKSMEPLANPHAIYHACFAPDKDDKDMSIPFEIRYSIYSNMKSGANMSQFFLSTFVANISQNMEINQVMNGIQSFPSQGVKEEFGADYGFTTMCNIDDKWSKKFDKGMINAIGCNDGAFVVISVLFNGNALKDNFNTSYQKEIMPSFYDLTFKTTIKQQQHDNDK